MNMTSRLHSPALAALAAACCTAAGCASPSAGPASSWYRGNTHTHTVLCGHADSTPEAVTAWYHARDYNFLILSEHNKFIDPATVKMPEPTRPDFILIPGVEITGARHIHTTGMNVSEVVPWDYKSSNKSKIIQSHVDGAIERGGRPISNHPNHGNALSAEDMLAVNRLHMFELYNGHGKVNNFGGGGFTSTEEMWDIMLTAGKRIYGVSTDDAHIFQVLDPEKTNPGRGWVMVNAPKLDPDAVTEAMLRGEFYASSGVFLSRCDAGPDRYRIEVDPTRTMQELAGSPELRGRLMQDGTAGYRIDFIGTEGKVLETVKGTQASYDVTPADPYVRAKVTFGRLKPGTDQIEEYYAWGQPVFTDGRGPSEPAPAP